MDAANGAPTPAGDFAFDDLLPGAPVFDSSNRRLAVANFSQLDNLSDPEPLRLIKMSYSLPRQRGVRILSLARLSA